MTRLRQAFAVFATVLIVLSAVPTGTAGQSITGDECDPDAVDYGVALLSPATAAYNYATSDGCAVEEVKQGNKEQEKGDVHGNLANMNASVRGVDNGNHNSLETARTVAWTKAEVATLKALENGSSQAQTRRDAREAVREHYARMQWNMIEENNRLVEQLAYLDNVTQMESLNDSIIDYTVSEGTQQDTGVTLASDPVTAETFQLVNGTNVTVNFLSLEESYKPVSPLLDTTDQMTYPGNRESWATYDFHIYSEYNGSTVTINSTPSLFTFSRIEEQNTQMLSNLNSTVNGLYGSYVRGDLDIEEYRSVQAAAMGWGQDLIETGYSTYAVVALAQAGESVPNLSATGSMTVESPQFNITGYNGTETGLVVGEPTDGSTSWQVGQTYDPAKSNGTVTFHVSGTNRSVELTEPFVLRNAEGKDGGDISTVDTQQYNYRTSNFSELGDKLDNLIELREEQQERIEQASSGNDGGFNFGIGDVGVGGISIVLLGGVALLLVASDRLPI